MTAPRHMALTPDELKLLLLAVEELPRTALEYATDTPEECAALHDQRVALLDRLSALVLANQDEVPA